MMAGEMTAESSSSKTNRGLFGLGFASGIYIAYDAMSTLNSSPWTHETFGGDPGKAESAQHYVRLALTRSAVLSGITSVLMGSPAPLIGAAAAGADLFYIYWKATEKATAGGH
jgi:hypothetical protein